MKHSMALLMLLALFSSFASCATDEPELPLQAEQPSTPDKPDDNNNPDNPMSNQLKITIDGILFSATLEDNATTEAFKALLPMTISMSELNGNEKYYNLLAALPTASANPGIVRAGDLMLFGSATLVLFYETFSTSYSYTRIGRVDNAPELAATLGSSSIRVKIELQ